MITLPVIPRSWIAIAVVVVVSGAIANTYRLSAAVDREHAKLVQCQADKKSLQDAINDQNDAIVAWKKAASEATERASAAQAEVDRLEQSRKQVLADLDVWVRRANENECEATKRLLLEYRR